MNELLLTMERSKLGVSEGATLKGQITRAPDGTYTSVGGAWGGWAFGELLDFSSANEFSYGFSPIANVYDYGIVVGYVFGVLSQDVLPLSQNSLNLRTRTQVSGKDNVVIVSFAAKTTDNRLHLRFPDPANRNIFQLGTSTDGNNVLWTAQLTRAGYSRDVQIRPYWAVNANMTIKITN